MKFSPLLLLSSSLFLTAKVQAQFESVPLHQFSAPSNFLYAKYTMQSNETNTSGETVELAIQTGKPSLNLDNVPGLKKIGCSGESFIRVILDDTRVAESWIPKGQEEDGLLVLINPKWNCGGDDKATYRQVYSMSIKPHVVYLHTKKVDMKEHSENILIKIGSPENNNQDGYILDWSPESDVVLADNKKIQAQCIECSIKGNFGVLLNITKPRYMLQVPQVEARMSGSLKANTKFKLTKKSIASALLNRMEFYRQSFQRFEIPGVVTVDPIFSLTGGVSLPEGPMTSFTTAFTMSAAPFSAHVAGANLNNQENKPIQPEFKGQEFTMTSQAPVQQESDLTILLDLTPKMTLDLNLFDKVNFPVGVGIETFLEGNIQTGSFASPECEAGQSKLSLNVGAKTLAYFGEDNVKPFGLFGKKQIYHTCKNEQAKWL